MTLVAVLAALGIGQVIGWVVFLVYLRRTPFVVLLGRAAARKLVIGTARSRRPLAAQVADFRREFDRCIAHAEEDES